jgi:hypothetical protein
MDPSMVQIFFQGHTRRALMFIEGGYDAYLAGRGLIVYACARAIYETFACVRVFCDQLAVHLANGDLEKTCTFILSRQFSTRMFSDKEVIVNEILDTTAVNILTQLDRVSEDFPTFREEYDCLCERTHPNGFGALLHFSELDVDYNYKFSNGLNQDHVISKLLRAGGLLAIMDHEMSVIEAKVSRVADAHRNELEDAWNILKSVGNRQQA